MKQVQLNADFLASFYRHLITLVDIETCFWDDNGLRKAVNYCFNATAGLGAEWERKKDKHGNLFVYSKAYNVEYPILYLSSHVDTVGAEGKNWLYPPFKATVTPEYIIGRGVNDCKAGTAFQIALLETLRNNQQLSHYNIGFFFIYREEGNQLKTSSFIDFETLPTSKAGTFFMTLENTVKVVNKSSFEIAAYNREPHNLFIEIVSTLRDFRCMLNVLLAFGWKPVVVQPLSRHKSNNQDKILYNSQSGHSATQRNETLISLLKSPDSDELSIRCGNESDVSVVSDEIHINSGNILDEHRFILNYRGFGQIKDIRSFLIEFPYKEYYDFSFGLGSDQAAFFENCSLLTNLLSVGDGDIKVSVENNPGRSDASAIYNSLSELQKTLIIPFACGPGCRTHTDTNGIRHATHGENEGFYKPSGERSLSFLNNLINKFKITNHETATLPRRQLHK